MPTKTFILETGLMAKNMEKELTFSLILNLEYII
jgi:hypothetical protein